MESEKVSVLNPGGWIFDTNPYIHFLIKGTFYVFAPEVGSCLEGNTNRFIYKVLGHIFVYLFYSHLN